MTEISPLEDIFLRRKPSRLMVYLKQEKYPYASSLAKKIDCTYAHTVKLLNKLQELNLVKFAKEGRVKFIELTDKGKDLADEFEILIFRRMANIKEKAEESKEKAEESSKPTPREAKEEEIEAEEESKEAEEPAEEEELKEESEESREESEEKPASEEPKEQSEQPKQKGKKKR